MHGGVGSGGLCGELSRLHLLDDAIEVGVHVGVLRRVELVFKGRDVLVARNRWDRRADPAQGRGWVYRRSVPRPGRSSSRI